MKMNEQCKHFYELLLWYTEFTAIQNTYDIAASRYNYAELPEVSNNYT